MVNRIVTENGELISPRILCIPRSIYLRPSRGEYIRTKDGKTRYEVLSVEWRQLPEDPDDGLLMTLREVPIAEEELTGAITKPVPLKNTVTETDPPSAVPHFYLRYRCKNCGSKYGTYPEQCHSCGAVGCFEEIEPEYQSLI